MPEPFYTTSPFVQIGTIIFVLIMFGIMIALYEGK